MAEAKAPAIKVIATNRKATHDFHIHDRFEAGIVLVGSEVKSLRDANAVIADGWAEVRKGEVWLHGIQINEYPWANRLNHEIKRVRKLLLHKREIGKLETKTNLRGYTLIPLSLYFKDGKVKVELALVTHKKMHDKRAAKREADDQREIDRAVKRAR
ncbi:MAG TPA: SsrA-binding protein SmpB [Kofleriaceae bacterium]|nr:SsrA-binding protein SmpB [Kofleriaceae bacterium]